MDDRAIIVFHLAFEQGIALDLDQCERIAASLRGQTITPQTVADASRATETTNVAVA